MNLALLSLGGSADVIISIACLLFAGFLLTRLTKAARLPNVTAYILAGVLLGPCVLDLIPHEVISGMDFVSDVALAFIAFGVGRFFRRETLRGNGRNLLILTFLEAGFAFLVVTPVMRFAFGMDWDISLLLGAIATATAPASTMMTIRQYKAKGPFVDALLPVVALDDAVCLLLFSGAAAVVSALDGGAEGGIAVNVLLPIAYNVGAVALGLLCGFIASRTLGKRSRDNRLILAVAANLLITGLCCAVGVSPLLACMAFGASYVNLSGDDAVFDELDGFTPPIFCLFFMVSGMNLDLGSLAAFGIAGVGYFLARIAGKYAGSWIGCAAIHADVKVRRWFGMALVPQAGVAIGLAFLAKRLLPDALGTQLMTIILASSVLYELVGPVLARLALKRSGAIEVKKPETLKKAG